MPVAVYARVSTEEQRERQSIETQYKCGERFCHRHDFSVFRVYSDDGISGTVPLNQRPQGSLILRDARLGKFDQLLVYKLDRLGRDTLLILNAVNDLKKLRVRVRSMTEEFDASIPTGELMLTMLSGIATLERAVIRERSLAGTNRVADRTLGASQDIRTAIVRSGRRVPPDWPCPTTQFPATTSSKRMLFG